MQHSNELRTIRLYGKLGAQFGRVHRLAVSTPAEAVRALMTIHPGFEKFLMNAKDHGFGFSVFVGKTNLTEVELRNSGAEGDIRIAPMFFGSKSGLGQIILGAVLIVVGIYIQYENGGKPNAASNYLYGAGINMIVGGVIQLLAPHPRGQGSKDKNEDVPSYAFNGTVNTMAQGNPVPLLYGKMKAGSAVISAGIFAEDNNVVPTTTSTTGTTGNPIIDIALGLMGGGGGGNRGDQTSATL